MTISSWEGADTLVSTILITLEKLIFIPVERGKNAFCLSSILKVLTVSLSPVS